MVWKEKRRKILKKNNVAGKMDLAISVLPFSLNEILYGDHLLLLMITACKFDKVIIFVILVVYYKKTENI